jgi:hypothetical protein
MVRSFFVRTALTPILASAKSTAQIEQLMRSLTVWHGAGQNAPHHNTENQRIEFVRTRLAESVVRFEPLILLCDQIDHLPGQRLKMNRCSRKIW